MPSTVTCQNYSVPVSNSNEIAQTEETHVENDAIFSIGIEENYVIFNIAAEE